MRKVLMIAGAVACAAWLCGSAWVHAEAGTATEVQPIQYGFGEDKPLKPDELTIKAGKTEGFKTPSDVVKRAIKLAKENKLDDIKSCFSKTAQDALAWEDYEDGKSTTNLKLIGSFLATIDDTKLREMKQCETGNYAVVGAESEKGTHFLRVIINGGDWKLMTGQIHDYRTDYSKGLEDLKKAVTSGTGAEVKKYVSTWETPVLDLLEGAVDGVDPYDLLAKKLKKLVDPKLEPIWLIAPYDGGVALWFHGEKTDTAIAYRMTSVWNDKTHKSEQRPELQLNAIAMFNKTPGNQLRNWTSYVDWGSESTDDGSSDEKTDGSEKDMK